MPLLIGSGDYLFPIGTAFTIGGADCFALSALHNVEVAFRYEQRLAHLLTAEHRPENVSLKDVAFYVLYPHCQEGAEFPSSLTLWPFETFNGAPPTDLIVGHPQFSSSLQTIKWKLSFRAPLHGQRMLSVGYHSFHYPEEGISLDAVRSGSFDWRHDYGHRLTVVEGFVDRLFTQRFASGFIDGPWFTLDAEIFHGQSGGPIMDEEGFVRGINSAGATQFFGGSPTTIASLLYPLLLTKVSSGISLAQNFRINAEQPLLLWIGNGRIQTDGSEQSVGFRPKDGWLAPGMSVSNEMREFVHDDFSGYQQCRPAKPQNGEVYRFRKIEQQTT